MLTPALAHIVLSRARYVAPERRDEFFRAVADELRDYADPDAVTVTEAVNTAQEAVKGAAE